MTIQVESDLPINPHTFHPKFQTFEVERPGPDTATIYHHFHLPQLDKQDLGQVVYRRPPWIISQNGDRWFYLAVGPDDPAPHQVAIIKRDHSKATIYHESADSFSRGNLHSLTMLTTDQILLVPLLTARRACFIHSSGVILDGHGLLFVGHSEAGKSTTIKLLKGRAETLCDDRMIVRRWPEGFKIHGTWSHGEVPDVSNASAPLRAILFLNRSTAARLTPLEDRQLIVRRLLACLIKPLGTTDWWRRSLDLIELLAREAPCYEMEFDKSGEVVSLLEDLVSTGIAG